MKNYAQILATLHDETEPVGHLGRGTHHSILRTTTWFDEQIILMSEPKYHDFAVIWDEDHDERVIDAIKDMYKKKLLSPVLFIGERKGGLNIIISPEYRDSVDEPTFKEYVDAIVDLAQSQEDPWSADVSIFGESDAWKNIINDNSENVELYLRNIQMLWNLGLKEFK